MKTISAIFTKLIFVINIALSQDGNTPTNLTIDAASVGGVQLSWDTPENFRKEWITHSNLQYQYGIGAGGAANFVCQKFPDSILVEYHGMLVKDMAFIPSADSDSASFQPLIFETDPSDLSALQIPDILGRSNLVLSAPKLSFSDNTLNQMEWNVIEMKDHIPGYSIENDIQPSSYIIDSTKTIWFGYWLYEYSGFPSGSDTGPADESLGNVIIWCPETGCFEATLSTSSDPPLLNGWLLALSLIPTGSSSTYRPIVLSNNNINLEQDAIFRSFITEDLNLIMTSGRPSEANIEPLVSLQRDISNYFVFENGSVADVVQPSYNDFNTTNREGTILGSRPPGSYTYFVRAQTADGLSDSSNVVSVDITNNAPGNFFLISPEENASISVTPSNVNNPNTFIWTNSVDTDGQELLYLFKMCNISDSEICFDTSMTERIYQPTNQSIIDSFSLGNGEFDMLWSVRVTDGIDTLFAGGEDDSIRYFTFSTTQLGLDLFNIPTNYSLKQNYPNPFNPSTTIEYYIAKSEFVSISIFDLAGNKIKSILNLHVDSGLGYATWDGKNELEQNVSGGIYLYRIDTPSFTSTRKMILLK